MNNNTIPEILGPLSSQIDGSYVLELMEGLSAELDYKELPVGQRFTMDAKKNNQIYFIRSGAVSLYREPSSFLFELIEAPSIRGLIPIHAASYSMYIMKVIAPSEIAILDRARLYELLEENGLWETFSQHLITAASMMVEVVFKLTAPSAYEMVRYQLFDLMSKSKEIRESISVDSYICSKTRLSRSSVMRALSQFRTKGYIEMSHGILKKINNIPPKE